MSPDWRTAAKILEQGNLAVIPTDTVYGLVAKALNIQAIKKLDKTKERTADSPYIILISSLNDLNLFDIKLDKKMADFLAKVWPDPNQETECEFGPVSIILPCSSSRLEYLHRGRNLAFRLPISGPTRDLIATVGPLAAPSANRRGQSPARTVTEANAYFGNNVSIYIKADTEPIEKSPSSLIDITDVQPRVLRSNSYGLHQKFNHL
jgi:L-threonylcarbamoyladenylate synthase